jgi:hypothetical protein
MWLTEKLVIMSEMQWWSENRVVVTVGFKALGRQKGHVHWVGGSNVLELKTVHFCEANAHVLADQKANLHYSTKRHRGITLKQCINRGRVTLRTISQVVFLELLVIRHHNNGFHRYVGTSLSLHIKTGEIPGVNLLHGKATWVRIQTQTKTKASYY